MKQGLNLLKLERKEYESYSLKLTIVNNVTNIHDAYLMVSISQAIVAK